MFVVWIILRKCCFVHCNLFAGINYCCPGITETPKINNIRFGDYDAYILLMFFIIIIIVPHQNIWLFFIIVVCEKESIYLNRLINVKSSFIFWHAIFVVVGLLIWGAWCFWGKKIIRMWIIVQSLGVLNLT